MLDGLNVQVLADSDTETSMSDDGSHALLELFLTGPGDTVYMVENMDSSTGAAFCSPANANSTTNSASLTGSWLTGGGISGGMSDLHLECVGGVPAQLGYFLVGTTASDPGLVVSAGNMCVAGGPFYRYNVPATTSNSVGLFNAAGVLENFAGTSSVGPVGMETGYDVPDAVSGTPQVITAGSTWHFQVWYRDTPAGVGTSNFSNGLSVTF